MSIVMLIGLLMIVVGSVLFIRGYRGQMLLSEPHCAKCGYDVRVASVQASPRCPECGADLSLPGTVHFGRAARRSGLMMGGLVLIALPVGLILFIMVRGAMGLRSDTISLKTTSMLIDDLSTRADEPWVWQELSRRHRASPLSNEEITGAIDQLIMGLNAERQKNPQKDRPLTWSQDFIETAMRTKAISPEQFGRLCEAYYGPTPAIRCPSRVRAGQPVNFEVKYGGHWNLPGLQFAKALREIRLEDGRALLLNSERNKPFSEDPDYFSHDGVFGIDGSVAETLPPGEHELTFVLDAGVLPMTSPFITDSRRPGQMENWVLPEHTWTLETRHKIVILPEGVEAVARITDPAKDPVASGSLVAPVLVVRRTSNGTAIAVTFPNSPSPGVSLSFDLLLRDANNTEIPLGTFARSADRQSYTSEAYLPQPLPADLTKADLIFRPNPIHIEPFLDSVEIWGNEVVMKDVTLERFDLKPVD